jgi:hypothetical protein
MDATDRRPLPIPQVYLMYDARLKYSVPYALSIQYRMWLPLQPLRRGVVAPGGSLHLEGSKTPNLSVSLETPQQTGALHRSVFIHTHTVVLYERSYCSCLALRLKS